MLDNFDPDPYQRQQLALAAKVIKKDAHPKQIRYIGGAAVAYDDHNDRTVGGLIILRSTDLKPLEQVTVEQQIAFPYIPGLFSFREVPPLQEAYQQLKLKPDLILCAGHGLAHPRRIGLATHLGVILDIPTVGCAKNLLVGEHNAVGKERGSWSALRENEEHIGAALRTQREVQPIYVSTGHRVSLASAIDWTLLTTKQYRVPKPVRQADQLVQAALHDGA